MSKVLPSFLNRARSLCPKRDQRGITQSGLRLGTTEVTRLGMHETEMETIADFIARLLIERANPEDVVDDVIAFRQPYQTLYYCFEHAMPDDNSHP